MSAGFKRIRIMILLTLSIFCVLTALAYAVGLLT
jgi:hypothetical protein